MALFGTLAVAIIGDTSKFNQAMDDAGKKSGSFGETFGQVASGIGKAAAAGVAAAATAFAGLAVKSLNLAGELEQNIGGSEAVFGKFASTVQKKGAEAFEVMGLAQSDFLATANKMGSLLQGSGLEISQSMDLSTAAMQRAADVASIMGIDIDAAMESVAGAAKGNMTMMDNLGVAMNATTIEAYAMAEGTGAAIQRLADEGIIAQDSFELMAGALGKSWKEMDQAEKVALSMGMFLDKTAYAAGNYAKENETLSGSVNTAKAALVNFLSGAGSPQDVSKAFSNAADVIVRNFQQLLPGLVSGLTSIVGALIPRVPAILSELLPSIVDGASALISGFVSIAPRLIDTVLGIFPSALKTLASGLGEALPILTPMTSAIGFLADNFDKVALAVTPVIAGLVAFKAATAISGTIDTFRKSMEAANKVTEATGSILAASTTLQGAFAAAATNSATAEAVRTAAKKAGMTVDTAGNLITASGTAATTAETAAVLASSGALTAKSVIAGVLSGKIGIVTAAQWLWNAAMAANPIGLLVAGAAALTAGIVGLVSWINRDTEEQKALKSATEGLATANDSLVTSVGESSSAYESNAQSLEANRASSEQLVGKIYELSEAENKSAEDKERLALYVEQLNGLMPELNLQYDKETDALNMTRDATLGLVDAKIEEAKQDAAKERAVELAREQMETENLLNETTRRRIELEERKAEGLDRSWLGGFKLQGQLDELTAQEAELTTTLETQEAALTSLTETMVESAARQAEATDSVVKHVKSAQEIQDEIVAARKAEESEYTEHLIEQANQWGMTLDEYKGHLQDLEREEERISKERADTLKRYTDKATDMFSTIETKSEVSVKEMISNLEENQKAVAQWSENLERLSKKGVDEGLLTTLRNAGPESAATVNALVNASDKELQRLSDVFANGSEVATRALESQFGLPSVTGAGSNMVDEISAGVTGNTSLTSASEQLIQSAKATMDSKVSSGEFTGIGSNMIQGIINGINSKASALYSAITTVATETAQKARDALEIKSPSRVFDDIGAMTGQGYVDGVMAMVKKARSAMGELVSVPADSIRGAALPIDTTVAGVAAGAQAQSGQSANATNQNPIVVIVKAILDGHEVGYAVTEYISRQQGQDLNGALRAAGVMG